MPRFLRRACRAADAFAAGFGRMTTWVVVLLMLNVLASVFLNQLRISHVASFPTSLPLLGNRLTANGLADLQWHLFAFMCMLGAAYCLRKKRHVSVDVLSGSFSPRTRRLIEALGDLLLLLPFCSIMVWYGVRFAWSAYLAGEGSSYGGLVDRFLVKSLVPLGFTLLIVSALSRTILSIDALISDEAEADKER